MQILCLHMMLREESGRMRTVRSGIASVAACAGACGATAWASSSFAAPQGPARARAVSHLRGSGRSNSDAAAVNRGAHDEDVRSWPNSAPAVVGGFVAALAVGTSALRRHGAAAPRSARGIPTTARQATITATIESEEALDFGEEAKVPVQKTSVLVLGSTGTLGRQVVKMLLNAGFSVRCILRNKPDRQFSFLVDWGATVVEGSLVRPESLPSALVGIDTVVDCSTARPEESIYDIDWDGKKTFIQCCEKMNIQRYIFMSIKDCDKHQSVPLMQIKYLTEKFLEKTKMRSTILRVSGFFQPLIGTYVVPILDEQEVYGDDGEAPGIAYLDSTDCARMIVSSMSKERTVGQTLTLTGPKVWSTNALIDLCCSKSGKEADINKVSDGLLKSAQGFTSFFKWSVDVAERLRFAEVNSQAVAGTTPVMTEKDYELLGMDPKGTRDLDSYIDEFYRRMLKTLAKGKYEQEAADLEKEKQDAEKKLKKAMKEDDGTPAGQPARQEVSLGQQRDMADRLQKFYEDKLMDQMGSSENDWFGLTKTAEIVNGRSAMMGFSLGMFTEWATEVSVSKQIDLVLAIFSPPS